MGHRMDPTIPFDAPQAAALTCNDAKILVHAIERLGADRGTLFVTECAAGYDVLDVAPETIDRALGLLEPDIRFAIRLQIDGVLEYARADGFAVGLHRVSGDGHAEIRLSAERITEHTRDWGATRTIAAFEALGFRMFGPQTEVSAQALRQASAARRDPDSVRLTHIAAFALAHRGPEARVLAA